VCHAINKLFGTVINCFVSFYGSNTFLEKSAIRGEFGFISKKNPNSKNKGYPDFLKEQDDYIIVVEAKATKQEQAIEEVKHYVQNNEITKDIVGIAVSGQSEDDLKVDYFLKQHNSDSCTSLYFGDSFLSLDSIAKLYKNKRYGSSTTNEELIKTVVD
jgi:hypothetical protein